MEFSTSGALHGTKTKRSLHKKIPTFAVIGNYPLSCSPEPGRLTFGAESATLRGLLPDPETTTSSFKIQANGSGGSKSGIPINTGALVEVKKKLSKAWPQELESRPETTCHTLRRNFTANRGVMKNYTRSAYR